MELPPAKNAVHGFSENRGCNGMDLFGIDGIDGNNTLNPLMRLIDAAIAKPHHIGLLRKKELVLQAIW